MIFKNISEFCSQYRSMEEYGGTDVSLFHSVSLPCYSCTMCSLAPPTSLEFKWCAICKRRSPSKTARVQLCSVLLGVHNIVHKALTHGVVQYLSTTFKFRISQDWKLLCTQGRNAVNILLVSRCNQKSM